MMRLRIGIDIDGTLADNLQAFVEVFNERTGKNLTKDDIYDFDLSLVYGLPAEEVDQVFLDHAERVFGEVPVMKGARKALEMLNAAGIELYLVTARHPMVRELTKEWVEKHRLPYDKIVFEPNKGEACRRYGLKAFVDDNFDNAVGVVKVGSHSVLVDAPYNRHLDHHKYGIARLFHWGGFPNLVETKLGLVLSA